jgi:hypothetical protein
LLAALEFVGAIEQCPLEVIPITATLSVVPEPVERFTGIGTLFPVTLDAAIVVAVIPAEKLQGAETVQVRFEAQNVLMVCSCAFGAKQRTAIKTSRLQFRNKRK